MQTRIIKPHHHGNLREALINAGMQLLEEGGITALTLRKCAAHAGVSHAAPAHHFEGLQGLIQAICQQGMLIFASTMQNKIDLVEDSPFPKLYAMCEGYLAFYIKYPALANLMFNQKNDNPSQAREGRKSNSAFNILVSTCAPFKHGPLGHEATEYAIWSLIQGFSHLTIMGQISCESATVTVNFADLLAVLNLEIDASFI